MARFRLTLDFACNIDSTRHLRVSEKYKHVIGLYTESLYDDEQKALAFFFNLQCPPLHRMLATLIDE